MGLFGPKSKLGIDIGTYSIKIVELSKEGGRFKLLNYGLFQLKSNSEAITAGQKIAKLGDEEITWGIKEVLKRARFSSKDAVASIPSFSTFATVITLPYLSEKDLAQAIPFEAKKYIPIPLNEVVLDWSIISATPPQPDQNLIKQSPMVEVFLAAVPRDETIRYQNIARGSGLNLRALELENIALIRSLVGNDRSPMAIVNIGGRSTSILVVDKGVERVSHTYEVGGFEITKSISRTFNISLERAEELKRKTGIKTTESSAVLDAVTSLLDTMVFETKKTITTYEENKNVKVSKILLVGGLSNMPQFYEYFKGKLGLSVDLGNPLSRVIYPKEMTPLVKEFNAIFAVALGLGMREI